MLRLFTVITVSNLFADEYAYPTTPATVVCVKTPVRVQ